MVNPGSTPVSRRRFASYSPEATERCAAELGARLTPGSVLALEGELGAGKTAFVRGLARGLGVEERVHSPTFTLMHLYQGRLDLYHYDAWMEGRERAFLGEGGAEELGGEGVAVIEWAARVTEWLPRPHLRVELLHRSPQERELLLELVGAAETTPGPALLEALAAPNTHSELIELPLDTDQTQVSQLPLNPTGGPALEGEDHL